MGKEQKPEKGNDGLPVEIERPGYLALVEGDIIKIGDEWQTMGDTPEWLIVEEGDINIGKKYLPGTYMIMRRAR